MHAPVLMSPEDIRDPENWWFLFAISRASLAAEPRKERYAALIFLGCDDECDWTAGGNS